MAFSHCETEKDTDNRLSNNWELFVPTTDNLTLGLWRRFSSKHTGTRHFVCPLWLPSAFLSQSKTEMSSCRVTAFECNLQITEKERINLIRTKCSSVWLGSHCHLCKFSVLWQCRVNTLGWNTQFSGPVQRHWVEFFFFLFVKKGC